MWLYGGAGKEPRPRLGLSYSLLLIPASNQHLLWAKVKVRVFELCVELRSQAEVRGHPQFTATMAPGYAPLRVP